MLLTFFGSVMNEKPLILTKKFTGAKSCFVPFHLHSFLSQVKNIYESTHNFKYPMFKTMSKAYNVEFLNHWNAK